MPVILAWLGDLLMTLVGQLVIKAALAIGLSFITYHFAVAPFKTLLVHNLSGMSAIALNILGFLKIDVACTMILSAIAAKFAVNAGRAVLARS